MKPPSLWLIGVGTLIIPKDGFLSTSRKKVKPFEGCAPQTRAQGPTPANPAGGCAPQTPKFRSVGESKFFAKLPPPPVKHGGHLLGVTLVRKPESQDFRFQISVFRFLTPPHQPGLAQNRPRRRTSMAQQMNLAQ